MSRHFSTAAALALVAALLVGCGNSRQVSDPQHIKQPDVQASNPAVVAVIDGQPITLEEFEREYVKSAGGRESAASDSLEAYQDFLDRYVNFKVKVAEARAAGMMQDSSIQAELASYRERMARPYMLDKEILDPIMRDLFDRMQTVVSTSHILVKVAPDASPQDTLAAYNKALALLDSLKNGGDFGDLAFKYSDDPSAHTPQGPGSHGKLGPVPPGMLVEEYESMAYATPVGQISPIFRSQFGYHILRVEGKEPAIPDVRVAQINIVPPGRTPADSARVRNLLDSLRARIEAGERFDDLARKYSEHQVSGGSADDDMGFWINYYQPRGAPKAFLEAAFALKQAGDVSDVVVTPYGMHLIQLKARRDLHNYEAMKAQLRQKAQRMPRTRNAQAAFLDKIQAQYHLAVDTASVLTALSNIAPDSLPNVLRGQRLPAADLQKAIVHLGDSTFTLRDLASFAKIRGVQKGKSTRDEALDLLNRFVVDATVNYASATLEERSPEFHKTMDDFRDGLLLFKIMEDSVWSAANADSLGRRAYFLAHKDKYHYPDRTKLVTFNSTKQDLLEKAGQLLDGGYTGTEIQASIADSTNDLLIDTTYAAGVTHSILDKALLIPQGSHTSVLASNNQYQMILNAGMDRARPMTFEEARGQVVVDYQQVLDSSLVQRLRRKHSVRVYPQHLTAAFSGGQLTQTASAAK
ncbi:MAG TPA: peptidylprolyl isomerase [Rhodothermales bacterium]|nr:peptidylprolyl isomerase [Rhodothermales bacterium]